MEYGEIPLEELNTSGIIAKTNALMSHLITAQQNWCLDTLLDIIFHALSYTQKKIQESKSVSMSATTIGKEANIDTAALTNLFMITEGLVDNFETCMEFLSSTDLSLVEKSVQCIFVMLQLFGTQRVAQQRQVYFVEGHVRHLLDALRLDKMLCQKKVLKAILFSLDQESHALMLSDEQKLTIVNAVQPLLSASDKSVAATANKIVTLLKN